MARVTVTEPRIAGRRCLCCRRAIRLDSARAVFLFCRPDSEVWVCGPRCLKVYEDDDTGRYTVGGLVRSGGDGVRGVVEHDGSELADSPAPGSGDGGVTR